jgi:large subunit ribosomal protein L25
VLDVAIDGGKQHSAILKEFQRDRVRGTITHVDLQEVRLDQPIQTSVSVALVGDPIGVREGGVLSQVTNEISVEALPLEVPQGLEVDVSAMGIGDTLRLTELVVPEGVTLLDDPEEIVLATVTLPTLVVEPEVEEEELEEGAEPAAEGEEPAGETGGEAAGEGGGEG